MTILNGTTSRCIAAPSPRSSGRTARESRRCSRRCSVCSACAPAASFSMAATSRTGRRAKCWPPASATCRRAATSFPSCRCGTTSSSAAYAAGPGIGLAPRIERAMDRFPVLRKKAGQQARTLSGGEQKKLEIVRGLLLEPKLMLIDEPSIGLSPMMVAGDIRHCEGASGSWHHDPDGGAERQERARKVRLRTGAGAGPDTHQDRAEHAAPIRASGNCFSAATIAAPLEPPA